MVHSELFQDPIDLMRLKYQLCFSEIAHQLHQYWVCLMKHKFLSFNISMYSTSIAADRKSTICTMCRWQCSMFKCTALNWIESRSKEKRRYHVPRKLTGKEKRMQIETKSKKIFQHFSKSWLRVLDFHSIACCLFLNEWRTSSWARFYPNDSDSNFTGNSCPYWMDMAYVYRCTTLYIIIIHNTTTIFWIGPNDRTY